MLHPRAKRRRERPCGRSLCVEDTKETLRTAAPQRRRWASVQACRTRTCAHATHTRPHALAMYGAVCADFFAEIHIKIQKITQKTQKIKKNRK